MSYLHYMYHHYSIALNCELTIPGVHNIMQIGTSYETFYNLELSVLSFSKNPKDPNHPMGHMSPKNHS